MDAATANVSDSGTTYSDCAKVKSFLKGIRLGCFPLSPNPHPPIQHQFNLGEVPMEEKDMIHETTRQTRSITGLRAVSCAARG